MGLFDRFKKKETPAPTAPSYDLETLKDLSQMCWEAEDYEGAVKYLKPAAKQGDAESLYRLAYIYHHAHVIDLDVSDEENYNMYLQAAAQGYLPAMHELGEVYQYGSLEQEMDGKKALYWYRKAADQGYAPSIWEIAVLYQLGDLVEEDFDQAVEWFKKSAEAGDDEAYYEIGQMYLYNGEDGKPVDAEQAAYYLKKSVEQGCAYAMYDLAYMYQQGIYFKQNDNLAYTWFREAALKGDATAQYELALAYGAAKGTEEDFMLSFLWLHRAANQGNYDAMLRLAFHYSLGHWCVPANRLMGYRWFQRAFKGGHEKAIESANVFPLPADMTAEEKSRLERLAKHSENPDAAFSYALLMDQEDDPSRAIFFYELAFARGKPEGAFEAGLHYLTGDGLEEASHEKAIFWLKKAAEAGCGDAMYFLGELCRISHGMEEDPEAVIAWYRDAAAAGCGNAYYGLGCAYMKGYGVEKDLEVAGQWFQKAADAMVHRAYYWLGWLQSFGGLPGYSKLDALTNLEKGVSESDERCALLLALLK